MKVPIFLFRQNGRKTIVQLNISGTITDAKFVTKTRWVNEQLFGRLKKKFKLFAIPAHNATLFHDYDSLLIAFTLLNLFHIPILSDKNDENMAALMKSRVNVPNLLKDVVGHYNLSKVKVPYIEVIILPLIMKKTILFWISQNLLCRICILWASDPIKLIMLYLTMHNTEKTIYFKYTSLNLILDIGFQHWTMPSLVLTYLIQCLLRPIWNLVFEAQKVTTFLY